MNKLNYQLELKKEISDLILPLIFNLRKNNNTFNNLNLLMASFCVISCALGMQIQKHKYKATSLDEEPELARFILELNRVLVDELTLGFQTAKKKENETNQS